MERTIRVGADNPVDKRPSADKVDWQKKTRDDPSARLAFRSRLIREKLKTPSEPWKTTYRLRRFGIEPYKHSDRAKRWSEATPTISSLLGFEGSIASDYFRVWTQATDEMESTKATSNSGGLEQLPIQRRTALWNSLAHEVGRSNRGATHPVNAMLNYAYGVLIARTRFG